MKILSIWRTLTIIVVLVGVVGSLGLMFHASRKQESILLLVLFTGWVLSPYIALMVAVVISKRWSALSRATLYSFMFILALGSLVCYSGAVSPPNTKPAFMFLVVPFVSWLLIAIVITIAMRFSRKDNGVISSGQSPRTPLK